LDLTTNTVENFSSYLEEAGLIFFVKRFSFKVKEQEKSARKVYSIDVGLANAIGFKFSSNIGKIAENLVAIELKRKETRDPNMEIYYWKNQRHEEVDFLVKVGQKVKQLIQVCWNINEYKTKERELKALLKASREVKCRDLLVITEDYEAEEEIKAINKIYRVKFLSLSKWLRTNIKKE
jgi:predicted AAA+ superfamily ATPase